MASQQVIIADFVEKLKRKRAQREDPYIYDDPAAPTTNRGNKLKRNAQYVQLGQLNNSALYKERVELAGYQRDIIFRNPPMCDADGDVIPDDEDMEDEDASPLEENIYKDIKLEELLAPLTAASDLPDHPTLSLPYRDKALPSMVKSAEETLHHEQQILWALKRLFTQFRGDTVWAPVGEFHTEYDDWLLSHHQRAVAVEQDMAAGVTKNGKAAEEKTNGEASLEAAAGETEVSPVAESTETAIATDDTNAATEAATAADTNGAPDATMTDAPEEGDADADGPARRMTTRAQAQHASRTSSIRSASPPPIHPFFLPPPTVIPDANFGLPSNIADETRMSLMTYISKQEEIVRACSDIHMGLLRALQMRQDVIKWCKAEGHVGEMSDGEDWYDMEEWGLDAPLKKGQEEEEQPEEEGRRKPRRAVRDKN
ncbi:hypothetical protein EJ06DRAFT_529231 [Trichodelitschia bisporula]|uniref:Transcriptional regulatory protein RXT2 N-terminal domain-containing protein n=1 Tax=Trichodelitschia bisporula TaxID=703511 RepID=A0A6G1HYC8_9PEZI|nr:hypothetical protein EJ06DRAFT_529231 [Trichodelitschia bisporula]